MIITSFLAGVACFAAGMWLSTAIVSYRLGQPYRRWVAGSVVLSLVSLYVMVHGFWLWHLAYPLDGM